MRDTTKYIVTFVLIMTVVVALILAGMNTALKPIHDLNETVYNKKSVLLSISDEFDTPVNDMSAQEVQDIFDTQIDNVVIDAEGNVVEGVNADEVLLETEYKKPKAEQRYPLYIYNKDDGSKIYIISVRGQGLWDAIWGSLALEEDLNTVAGASFDHAGETPGLGAEIKDNPTFPESFEGKKIYNDQGNLTSIEVVKGIIQQPEHQVEAISGATITMNGVTAMLERGLENYQPYFEKIQEQ